MNTMIDKGKVSESITSVWSREIWSNTPVTIHWLQRHRPNYRNAKEHMQFYELKRGVNKTIILLSATCLEGFLVECLNTFTIGYDFADKNTFQGRLDHRTLEEFSTATFGQFRELFKLVIGKSIGELINDEELVKGIQTLISFRNGIAHGRSVIYKSTDVEEPGEPQEFFAGKQYEETYTYLESKSLVIEHEDLFTDKIADHFAGLVKPYMEAVITELSKIDTVQFSNVAHSVKRAYREINNLPT